jgi:predicted DNA binding CopG/RHH family protein
MNANEDLIIKLKKQILTMKKINKLKEQIENIRKKKEPKTTQLNIRLTENEIKFIRDEAKKQNLDVTKFILKSINQQKLNI